MLSCSMCPVKSLTCPCQALSRGIVNSQSYAQAPYGFVHTALPLGEAFVWLPGSLYASEGDTRASYPGDMVRVPILLCDLCQGFEISES